MTYRIYFKHAQSLQKIMKNRIESRGRQFGIDSEVFTDEDCNLFTASKIDLYLIHSSEVNMGDIDNLRGKNPNSIIIAINNTPYKMHKEEKEKFDGVYGISHFIDEGLNEIFKDIKNSTWSVK